MSKLTEFIKHFSKVNYDAFMLNTQDEFLDEFTPKHLNRLKLLTGFSGSNGIAIISKNQQAFFTDGRYLLQAKQELDSNFKIYDLQQTSINNWITKNLPAKTKIAYDSRCFTSTQIIKIAKKIHEYDIKLYRLSKNPITIKSSDNIKTIEIFPKELSGIESKEKIKQNKLLNIITGKQAFFTCDTASICWLLNIRGSDTLYSPLVHSYFLYNKRESFLFCALNKVTPELKKHLKSLNTNIIALDNFIDFGLICKKHKIKQVFLDPNSVSYFFYRELQKHDIKIIKSKDPIIAQKAVKNDIEIKGIKKAHLFDGIAKTKFLFWLDQQKSNHSLNEISIANKLLEFRKEQKDFLYPSFNTISAFAENGAIIHYKASDKTNKKLDKDSLLLLDSGGQYKFGTTDVTRTIAIGKNIKPEYIRDYTLVLKGQIALATAIFPKNTTGAQLDILARQYLWQDYKDYEHGTGHGVGHFLNVHEGPQNIGKYSNQTNLEAGMVLSNEPGIYIKDQYGIRLENIILVRPESENFLSFETLTLIPFEKNLIDFSILTKREKIWLNCYNKKLHDNLSPYLDDKMTQWLLDKAPI